MNREGNREGNPLTRRHSGHIIPIMKAKLILHTKEMKGEEVVEMKVWQVPKSSEKPHGVKFSVVYIKSGQRLIGYDNAESQRYHRHSGEKVDPYRFTDIWKLIDDFKKDLKRLRGRDWDED
jgi:hypothetical protein